MAHKNVDFDGDGDLVEGTFHEMVGLHELLYAAIRRYSADVLGEPVCYRDAKPYWYKTSVGSGVADCTDEEAVEGNEYLSFTPRLLRAAYNYHTARQDLGSFAHNPRYVMELLYDSIADLNTQLPEPISLDTANRNAPGHFNGTSNAARNWDDDEAISGSCSTCR